MSTAAAFYLRHLVARLTAPENEVPAVTRMAAIDLGLKVMALVAAADRRVHEAEATLLSDLYLAPSNCDVNPETVLRAIERVCSGQDSVWCELAAASTLSAPLREDVLLVATHVALADGDLADSELELLQRIARELAINADRFDALQAHARAHSPDSQNDAGAGAFRLLLNSRGGKALRGILESYRLGNGSQHGVALDLTLSAMALMVMVDRQVDDAELCLTGEVYAALGGGEFSSHVLERAIRTIGSDPQRALEAFSKAEALDEATRRDILRAAFLVAQVDGQVDARERDLLEELGARLGFDAQQVMAVTSA